MKTIKLLALGLLSLIVFAACAGDPSPSPVVPTSDDPTPALSSPPTPMPPEITESPEVTSIQLPTVVSTPLTGPLVEVVASGLETPWEMVFLPGGELLVTERSGNLVLIGGTATLIQVPNVEQRGEGGLLGLALDPDYAVNNQIYVYLTSLENGQLVNRVERYVFKNGALSDRKVIFEGILGANNHDGGRIEFGPDGYLYITTGDAQNPDIAQDVTSLQGKILWVTREGEVPEGNPFATAVWSYGHRNPQGLAWDAEGRLWSTEHGPSGLGSGYDELNLITPGANYGWPEIQGEERLEGTVSPVIQSGGSLTWAPGDVEYLDGKLYFTGLRGSALYVASLDGELVTGFDAFFSGEYGRLRAVRLGPDGYLYVSTSNRDGRAIPGPDDDLILRVNPNLLTKP
jgi:glucose/arabinose dehydrogenase